MGAEYAERAASRFVSVEVAQVRGDGVASYDIHRRTVTVAETALDEDPRMVAAVLAHELRHSIDIDLALLGFVPGDCLTIEARGFATQAVVGRELYGGELPSATGTSASSPRSPVATSGSVPTATGRGWRRISLTARCARRLTR